LTNFRKYYSQFEIIGLVIFKKKVMEYSRRKEELEISEITGLNNQFINEFS
jgi:hypothetical protein